MIVIENLDFAYDLSQVPIFNNFQANFFQGLNIIAGPSGRGKSTLLSMMMGLIKPTNGKIKFSGQTKIGYMAQECELIGQLSVFDNVFWKALMYFEHETAFKKTQTLLALCGLNNFDLTAEKLSGGQKKRVALARALINDPDILIADEITAHLDKNSAINIISLVKKIAENKVVIISTHDQELIDKADYIIHL